MEDKIKEKLKELVKPKRYKHSMFVAEEARKLAKIYNEPVEKAYLTGLAHDIAKSFDNKENEKWIKRYDLDEKWLSKENEKLIHAEVGAVVAKEYFDFDDEMCNAIKYHTIGNNEMSTFDKIIYIADKIGRTVLPEDLKDLPEIAYRNLDEAILFFLIKQKNKFDEKGKKQANVTIELLNSLKGETRNAKF